MTELVSEKTALKSKTIINALLAAGAAAGGVIANTILENSTELSILLQGILPAFLKPFAPLLIQTLAASLTALFAKRAIDGRISATTKIATKAKQLKSKLP